MDSLMISSAMPSPSSSPLSIFYSKRILISKHPLTLPISSKNKDNDPDLGPGSDSTHLVPFLKNPRSLSPLSKDSAMGLVLSAAVGRGWTTGSGMEGPPSREPGSDYGNLPVSTFRWSLFTKSPRRRMRVAFTCNVCGQRTTRAINPHAYTAGTVFVQCCGCNVFHKLVDNLNLFHEMKCYVNLSFRYKGDVSFNFFESVDDEEDGGNIFPVL